MIRTSLGRKNESDAFDLDHGLSQAKMLAKLFHVPADLFL